MSKKKVGSIEVSPIVLAAEKIAAQEGGGGIKTPYIQHSPMERRQHRKNDAKRFASFLQKGMAQA